MNKKKSKIGPPRPDVAPLGVDGQPCGIVFGANAEAKMVLMMFSVTVDRLMFTPEQAHEVASNLIRYAEVALGRQPS